jgi:hypothetical protein
MEVISSMTLWLLAIGALISAYTLAVNRAIAAFRASKLLLSESLLLKKY